MPSSLPGMNPFLEQPTFWSSFHSRFIVAMTNAIEQTPPVPALSDTGPSWLKQRLQRS